MDGPNVDSQLMHSKLAWRGRVSSSTPLTAPPLHLRSRAARLEARAGCTAVRHETASKLAASTDCSTEGLSFLSTAKATCKAALSALCTRLKVPASALGELALQQWRHSVQARQLSSLAGSSGLLLRRPTSLGALAGGQHTHWLA